MLVTYNLRSRFSSSLVTFVLLSSALQGADPAEVAFQRATSAFSSQDYGAAERDFLVVLKLEPRNTGALGNLGVIYSRTGRYAKAIEAYQQALRIAPGNAGLLTNLGLAYIKQEQFAQALPIFEKLASDPSNLQARELVATCHLSLGHSEAAVAVLQPLLRDEPNEPGVLYMTGVALSRLKRTDEAHHAFEKMMRSVSPARANFLMGKASYETQRFDDAASYFRKSIDADASLQDTHRELGKTLISLRDDEGAEKELRLAGQDDPEAVYFLGGLLSQKKPEEAIPLLLRAQRMTPDFWGPLYYLGRVYVELGRTREALPLLERAAKLKPDESQVQYQLGRALQKLGRAADAKAAFARVRELKNSAGDPR